MLAHGSGIDDLLVLVAAVGAFLVVSNAIRRRRAVEGATASWSCAYCDQRLVPGALRCEACGFRARRAPRAGSLPPGGRGGRA